jgi:hypothetical protein
MENVKKQLHKKQLFVLNTLLEFPSFYFGQVKK